MKGLEFMAVKAAKCVSIVTFGCALVARPKSRERFGVNIVGVSLSFASRNKIGHQHRRNIKIYVVSFYSDVRLDPKKKKKERKHQHMKKK